MFNFDRQWYANARAVATAIGLCLLAVNITAAEHQGLVIQVSENNPQLWNLVLNIAQNAPKNLRQPLDITVVAFGPGLNMLTAESTVAQRLEAATAKGVNFRACGMTMRRLKLRDEDLYPNQRITRVDGGVTEIMRLQKAGWSYIRP